MAHIPVLLDEVIKYLNLHEGSVIVDATVGTGGHAKKICKKIGTDGIFIGIDRDEYLIKKAEAVLKKERCPGRTGKTIFISDSFKNLDGVLKKIKIDSVNGVLFDLGMNTNQIKKSGRGFTFLKNEPLIMNYKSKLSGSDITAEDILNGASEEEIYEMLKEYGEERNAGSISKGVISERKKKRIKTTFDLVEIIKRNIPPNYVNRKLHFATKTFQALRIAVNDELNVLEEGLKKAFQKLRPGGRIVAISFHSLEDRIVKEFFKDKKVSGEGVVLTKKPVTPQLQEKKRKPQKQERQIESVGENE